MKDKSLFLFLLLFPAIAFGQPKADLALWYDEPAAQWEETLPLGNGRLGMMPDGGIEREHIVLNEISMWSGSEADFRNPKAAESLPAIRKLLLEGKNKEAQELMYSSFVPVKPEKGGTFGAFQMLADMYVDYAYPDTTASAEAYRRWLDLSESVACTGFTLSGTRYTREYFVSREKDVIAIHLKADRPAALRFRLTLSRPERGSVRRLCEGQLEISGTLDSGNPQKDGVRYAAVAGIMPAGAKSRMRTDTDAVEVSSADEAWIFVSAATSYLAGEIYRTEAQRLLDAALDTDPETLKAEAVRSYQALFCRAGVTLPENETTAGLTTDKRLEAFQTHDDPSLAALYYNYGRYLLISSTRPGSLPPNLQGLWANDTETPWNGDYHTNINVQMNHWPAEPGNLSELHLPLVEDTKGFADKAFFSKMKAGAIFINAARGGEMVEDDLVDALLSGKLYAAGLDCYSTEPLPLSSKLYQLDNVIMTPHNASATYESLTRCSYEMGKNVWDVMIDDKAPRNAVNHPLNPRKGR